MKGLLLEQLYSSYSKELYLYAFALCKDHYKAQELVSDTFYKALLTVEKGKNIEVKYWLFTVCKNIWLDSLKKNKIEILSLFDNIGASFKKDIIDDLIKDEVNKDLYKRIYELPQNYREVIILFYFCNLPLNVISNNLGLSSSATRTLLFRARQKLKNKLEEVK